MHLVIIAWIYVAFMMAITETSAVAAVMTFLSYGVLPVSILAYLTRSARRRRHRRLQAMQQKRQAEEAVASTPQPVVDEGRHN